MASREKTWIGYRPAAPDETERTRDTDHGSDAHTESRARSTEAEVRYTNGSSAKPLVLSREMVETLKRKLREAEARELGFGVDLGEPAEPDHFNGLLAPPAPCDDDQQPE